ncbi:PAS domain-containing protein [Methanolobus profundi]|uniref:histidine kinase n=1 Tax=Methanolobus profundi TaxID=487685 RepID=A0A1I4T379_9EURY|nr:PAS domain-containing protein [Methanolobus profundi]SFM71101.1 PAS domain S-box-containing protein [Methanolobus profundi]
MINIRTDQWRSQLRFLKLTLDRMNASSGVMNISDARIPGKNEVHVSTVVAPASIDKKLEAVYNSSPVISFLWKAEGEWPVEYVSGNITQLGYSTDDFLSGKLLYGDIVHPDDLDRIHLEVRKHSEKKNTSYFSLNYRILTKSNEVRWVTERSFIKRDENGNITHFQGIIIDNTELEKTEKELLETGKKYQIIFERSPVGILYFDENGIITHCNKSCSDIIGAPVKKIVGFSVLSSLNDENLKEAIDVVFLGNAGYYEGGYISSISGKRIMVRASFTPVMDDDGSLLGGIGILEDISTNKEDKELLALNEMRLEALLKLYQMQDYPMSEISEYAIQKAAELTNSTTGYLEFLNEDENVLETYHWPVAAEDVLMSSEEPFVHPVKSTGFWGEAIRERKPVIVNTQYDSDSVDDIYPGKKERMVRHITVPVFENEQIVAVASVANKSKDYDESDVRQLTLLMEGMWKLVQYKNTSEVLYEALRMRRMLESIMSSSPAIVFLWKPEQDWPVEFVSENIEQFGYTVADFITGKIIYGDIIHPSDLGRVRNEVERAAREGFSDFSHEYRILTRSGEVRWVDERTMLHYDGAGMVDYMQGIIVDITERKQANNFMRIECDLDNVLGETGGLEETFEKLLDFTLEGKAIDSGIMYVVDELTGEFDAISYRGLSESFVTSLAHFGPNTLLARLFTTGFPVYKYFSEINMMMPAVDLDHEGLQAMAFIPVKFNDNLVAAIILGSHTELEIPANSRNLAETIANQVGIIISRMKKDSGMQKSKNNMNSLLDALDEIVFIMDMEGQVLHINETLVQSLNYTPRDLEMKDFLMLYPDDWEDDVLSTLDEIMAGKLSTCDIPLVSKEGILVPVKSKFTIGDWGGQDVLISISYPIKEPGK